MSFSIGKSENARPDEDVAVLISAVRTHEHCQSIYKTAEDELKIAESGILKKREAFQQAKNELERSTDRIRGIANSIVRK
jgi:hypothetical protein